MTQDPKKQSWFASFFNEFWERLTTPSPAFFKVIQKFLIFVASLGGLALVLDATGKVPELWEPIINWFILAAAAAGYIVAKLPTVDKDRKVTDGELPYTAKKIDEGTEPIH